ncbi:hypothetical protein SAMN02982929_03021 [Saccharopolyspora kobensis]|uniref:DUF8017 domain-containing protein n=1 Tax=Saccharopolyspora kobensis TaxID=146035 RepID=A0A1H6C131_9PSEU|nr:hypothetical protein [Saccharopolyspora kobensis]SEG66679.1 hypothetical protein SAMN02982929_03021 [Saccharopolyspora kobensis]SFC23716.1 hypothetical protein SAMN05216506_101261 [Saccharopolyspora kobensis]
MSSPGGHWGSHESGQQYDPLTGQPVGGAQYPQPDAQQYQGFGAYGQPQQPQYQQYQQPQYPGMPGGYPTPPKKSKGPLITAIALGAVALIAIVTTAVVLLVPSGQQASPTPPPSPSTTKSTPTRTTTAPPSAANPDLQPVVPGWQVVRVPKRTALYDVPLAGWELDPDPENIQAYGPPDDPVTMTGVADYMVGFCPGDPRSYRATSGVSARKGPDDTTVANETLAKLVQHAHSRDGIAPIVETGAPEHIQLPGNVPAVRVTARVTLPKPGACDAATALTSVVATNSDGQSSVVMMATADQGVEGALSQEDLNKLTGSLRAAP